MARRPNLVFIMSDQQRYDTMACYGNDWIDTPNLNALASESFVFERAYVTQPVCTPARASIMTGLYPHSAGPIVNKMHLPAHFKTTGELVSPDCARAYMGKWHLGNDVLPQHTFDTWISTEDSHRESYSSQEALGHLTDYHRHLVANGFEPDKTVAGVKVFSGEGRARLPEEFQMASYLGDRAAEFIRENAERPFVLYVNTFEPHSPYFGPLMDSYDPDALPVGPSFLKKPDGASLLSRLKADYFTQYLEGGDHTADPYMRNYAAVEEDVGTEEGWRRLRAHYFANVNLVDRMVGKITSAIDDAGVADDTVVVFTSDHGDMLGDHGMLEKRSMYEESSRVPMLMRVPWLAREQTMVPGSMSHIDLAPTVLDLLGDPVPYHLQGKSLVPALSGEASLEDNDVFIEWNGVHSSMPDRHLGTAAIDRMSRLPWRTVVSGGWKLNLCAGDQCELFDLKNDPYEMRNLFDDPAQRDRVRDLAARIRAWQVETDDDAPLPAV